MLITITIDTEQVEKFADPDETLVDWIRLLSSDFCTGSRYAWTRNAANVGTIVQR